MFDSNGTVSASVGAFDEQRWAEERILDLNVQPTLRIPLRKNVYLKTMAIVDIRSDAVSADIKGGAQIFFAIGIRFRGF
jgi:hypothetical protein